MLWNRPEPINFRSWESNTLISYKSVTIGYNPPIIETQLDRIEKIIRGRK